MKKIKLITSCAATFAGCLIMFATTALGQSNPKLSDAEVAHAAVTANQIDIDYAAIAKGKSKDVEVLRFAETMSKDHKAVIDQAVALVTRLGVTPEENAVSRQLMTDAEKTKKMLRSSAGNAFDRVYINNEVTYHEAVISAVEGLLIPESENAELKALLQNVLPALKAHLAHAKMVQKQLTKK